MFSVSQQIIFDIDHTAKEQYYERVVALTILTRTNNASQEQQQSMADIQDDSG